MSSAQRPACPAGSDGSQYAAGTTWRRTQQQPQGAKLPPLPGVQGDMPLSRLPNGTGAPSRPRACALCWMRPPNLSAP
eukprot:11156630-Lingulodinium_polyedra.AAC.1